ncbi:hypothetical protein [Mycobacterium sp.]|uniref:hypothetical protein n=1 Tax=Mycobacterium sp. TaxID=1785 RepID=UPI003F9BDA83
MQRLIAIGLNDCAIARQTGIPRRTVLDWRRFRSSIRTRGTNASHCNIAHDFAALPAGAYCYLFGLYLGDGCISRHPRAWRLRITLDDKYPGIVDRCREAIDILMPGQRAATPRRSDNCIEVSLYSKHWPCLLPQHGTGKKHLRPIRLEPWQEGLVKEATEEFIRGLIDSDGCRVVANDSDDIRGLFIAALDELGIPWTRSSRYVIAICRRSRCRVSTNSSGPSLEF